MTRSNPSLPAVTIVTPADFALPNNGLLAAGQHNLVDSWLTEHGFVVFRGFDIGSDRDFDDFVAMFDLPNFPYADSFSNAVRTNRTERVFTANEAPSEIEIFLHHEMAQTLTFPTRLFFYCERAADEGGATPICRSDRALASLKREQPAFIERLAALGVCYRSAMPFEADKASGQGRSWRDTLGVATAQAAEQRLKALGYRYRWLDNQLLSVQTPPLPALTQAPDGVAVFFNQIVAAGAGWRKRADDEQPRLSYGDGSPIEEHHLAAAIDICYRHTVDIDWQDNDVALLDNYKVMHGRRPFKGRRSVLASLCAPVTRTPFVAVTKTGGMASGVANGAESGPA